MASNTPKSAAPITSLRSESEASHLLTILEAPIKGHPIGEIEVKSKEQPHISLGNFSSTSPPTGLCNSHHPDPEPGDIVTQVTQIGDEKHYEMVLHIANYGNKTVSAEVWQL